MLVPVLCISCTPRKLKCKLKGKHHVKCKGRCHTEVVSYINLVAGNPCDESEDILSEIVIIDLLPGIPEILRRKIIRVEHTVHKTVVHHFLLSESTGSEASEITKEQE